MTSVRKPSRRIVHTSDLHMLACQDKAAHSLEGVVNLAIKSRADLLLIAGDLFDQNRIDDAVLAYVQEQMWRIPIPVVILPGNHDCLVADSVYRSSRWRECRNVHILTSGPGETLELHDQGFSIWGKPIDTYDDVHPLKDMPRPQQNGAWNIAVAHGMYVRKPPEFVRSYIITEAELKGSGWDYMALGHMPRFDRVCDDPVACYSGSPTDTGMAALVDLEEGTGARITQCQLSQ
jgi:DNA repair exonuclease SbcCD nuclease subunit